MAFFTSNLGSQCWPTPSPLCCDALALIVVQPDFAPLQLLLEDSVLLDQGLDRALLLSMHPSGERNEENTERVALGRHRVIVAVRTSCAGCRFQGGRRMGHYELGHRVGRTTVSRILRSVGIKPAPDRPTSWRTFLRAHFGEIAATDFFTTEVWTPKGLVTYYTLFLVDLKTRRVHVSCSTTNPDAAFMAQIARNLTDAVDGFLLPHRFLICDRDTKFTDQFRRILKDAGVDTVVTPYRAPNCNAFAERVVRSIKEECLGRMIFFGERSLRRAIGEYVAHYHLERPHQGLGNKVIERARHRPTEGTEIRCVERLGGLLRHYSYAA
jgi:transposase InsO family protein